MKKDKPLGKVENTTWQMEDSENNIRYSYTHAHLTKLRRVISIYILEFNITLNKHLINICRENKKKKAC